MKKKKQIACLIVLIMLLHICLPVANIFAISTIFQVNNISDIDGQYILYKNQNDNVMGRIRVKLEGADNYLTPSVNNGNAEYALDDNSDIEVVLEASSGYRSSDNYFYKGNSDSIPGDNKIHLNVSGISVFDLSFQADNPGGPQGPNVPGPNDPQGPVTPGTTYPIVAYFEGIDTGVEMNEEGKIVIPDNWETGRVTFKAKTCTVNGVLAPNNGYNVPDPESEQEVLVRVEGIANASQLNGTVEGTPNNRSSVTFREGFEECGKATIHITSAEEGGPINTIISVIDKNVIYLDATAPLAMSMGVGSSAVSQAIVTGDVEKDLSIFFGNTQTTLKASGINVDRITGVNGNVDEVVLNADGSATIDLPALSQETTTKVDVTILLKDSTTITRTVNIKRTAILLDHDDREDSLKIGYVMNKAYLYNNQLHDDSVFDAYIQVILYKGNTVAGFRQIKVNDEGIVNALVNGTQYNGMNLPEDGSWSIETFGEDAMEIDLGAMEGITKASAFLTNGPISFDSETLPSVEFGIGSGLTIEFGGEK